MKDQMFCFQCEQTAKGTGCTGTAGVCGKSYEAANLQDELTGALIGLARCVENHHPEITDTTNHLILRALFTTVTNVNFDEESLRKLTKRIRWEKDRICMDRSCCPEFDMNTLWQAPPDLRSLKSLLLFGLRGMAAYAWHAYILGYESTEIYHFIYRALNLIGSGSVSEAELFDALMEAGRVNLKCMELLDKANTSAYGIPTPVTVELTIEKGPFIIVSGHDLYNLRCLLEETEGTGVSVYTHGEMLPAHGYPELRKFRSLKGHFGTAWQNQQKEFDGVPAPILFTTNCIMPPKESYIDRVYTTGPVRYPGTHYVSAGETYWDLIQKSLQLGGFSTDREMFGINDGIAVTTGWSYRTILSYVDRIADALNRGSLRRIFLVGGCDGAKAGRNYYTEFVKRTPPDTMVLTLACGKFRFNDLDLGYVAGLPRLMDLGQCNDAYGAVQILLTLAHLLKRDINDLPVSIVLSWYEQKAVSILLTLFSLGIQGIYLGPTRPACLTGHTLSLLQAKFGLRLTASPQADLDRLLGGSSENAPCLCSPCSCDDRKEPANSCGCGCGGSILRFRPGKDRNLDWKYQSGSGTQG